MKSREFLAKDERLISPDEARRYRTTVASPASEHRKKAKYRIPTTDPVILGSMAHRWRINHIRCAHLDTEIDALVGVVARACLAAEAPDGAHCSGLVPDAKSTWADAKPAPWDVWPRISVTPGPIPACAAKTR